MHTGNTTLTKSKPSCYFHNLLELILALIRDPSQTPAQCPWWSCTASRTASRSVSASASLSTCASVPSMHICKFVVFAFSLPLLLISCDEGRQIPTSHSSPHRSYECGLMFVQTGPPFLTCKVSVEVGGIGASFASGAKIPLCCSTTNADVAG